MVLIGRIEEIISRNDKLMKLVVNDSTGIVKLYKLVDVGSIVDYISDI